MPAHAAHVRTARLVGVAAARRAGLEDGQVDELRLALGEVCARAVALNAAHAPSARVRVVLTDDEPRAGHLVVQVHDAGPAAAAERQVLGHGLDDDWSGVDPEVSLAVVRALVDDVSVERLDGETVVTLAWRAS